jgi:hypothetical protein
MDNGRDRHIVSRFLEAVEARITALETDAAREFMVGDQEAAKLKAVFATEFRALAAEITRVFQDL